MKAITRTRYGGPEVLTVQEVEPPVPKDHEVLVRVHATTVNRTDCGILWARPFVIRFFTGLFKPKHRIAGTDFAGRVEAVGNAVTSFQVGDRVWGFYDEGLQSHAHYMTLAEGKAIAKIPDGITYAQAAASGEGAHYGFNSIHKMKLVPGQKVLVNGATGAIGSASVQLLKHYGLHVTATCATPHVELMRGLGADRVIDYTQEDFTEDAEQYHFVFDSVGKSTFGKSKRVLLPGGVYISSELGPRGENLYLPLFTRLFGKRRVIFPIPFNCRRTVLFMTQLIQDGKFKAVIDRTYAMEQVAEAYRYVDAGQKIGNVILSMED